VKPIVFLVIAVGVGSALAGSMAFQYFSPAESSPQQLGLIEKCEKIAQEGFKVQVKYSEIDLDRIPKDDADTLKYLDDLWMKECVSNLSPEQIMKIANKVQDEYYSGE